MWPLFMTLKPLFIFSAMLLVTAQHHTPSDRIHKKNLAAALLTRFNLTNRYEDLNEAIELFSQVAMDVVPPLRQAREQPPLGVRMQS
jgi:hypothetical protein